LNNVNNNKVSSKNISNKINTREVKESQDLIKEEIDQSLSLIVNEYEKQINNMVNENKEKSKIKLLYNELLNKNKKDILNNYDYININE